MPLTLTLSPPMGSVCSESGFCFRHSKASQGQGLQLGCGQWGVGRSLDNFWRGMAPGSCGFGSTWGTEEASTRRVSCLP